MPRHVILALLIALLVGVSLPQAATVSAIGRVASSPAKKVCKTKKVRGKKKKVCHQVTVSVCVGSSPGCFSTIRAALTAARNGDVIHIGPGTFIGGITINKSVSLLGAGAQKTILSGGGPVVTIGTSSEPTVSIDGVTITGGVNRHAPSAFGGGVEIPPNAKVTISNSVITGNRADPTTAIDSTIPCPSGIAITCINGDLPYAGAAGGGIDNWGALTLENTKITHNQVGAAAGFTSVASDAEGAGIFSHRSSPSLSISNTDISDNQASAVAPNGRFAESGGLFVEGGTLMMSNTVVTHNLASLATGMPDIASGTGAVGGGVHVAGGVTSASIRNTTISNNSISMTNTVGSASAFSGGLHTDVNVALSNDVIANNSVYSATLPGSTANAGGDSGAGEMQGTIVDTRLTGNTVTASSVAGSAYATAGAMIVTGTMTSSVVSGNSVHAASPKGSADVAGAGLQTEGALTLSNVTVSDNTGDAQGRTGTAQGGGIFAVDQSPNGPPGGPLILTNSHVTGNMLSGSAGILLQGGGLYVTNPLTLTNSAISGNVPDNCFRSSC